MSKCTWHIPPRIGWFISVKYFSLILRRSIDKNDSFVGEKYIKILAYSVGAW